MQHQNYINALKEKEYRDNFYHPNDRAKVMHELHELDNELKAE